MIQLNVLPDVKLEYVKAQRTKRIILSVSVMVSLVAIAILIIFLGILGLQKHHLSNLNHSINKQISQLEHEPNLNQILTVQNQLASLNTLHNSKPNVTNLYNYIDEITPQQVSISNLTIDFTADTVTLSGNTNGYASINQYVDIIKNTAFSSGGSSNSANAFSNVVLAGYSQNVGSNTNNNPNDLFGFSINFNFNKALFDISQNVSLTVPSETPNRLTISQPSDLFQSSPTPATSNNGGSQ